MGRTKGHRKGLEAFLPFELLGVSFAFVFKCGCRGVGFSGSDFSMVAPPFPHFLPACIQASDHLHLSLFVPVCVSLSFSVFLGRSLYMVLSTQVGVRGRSCCLWVSLCFSQGVSVACLQPRSLSGSVSVSISVCPLCPSPSFPLRVSLLSSGILVLSHPPLSSK